VFWSLLADIVIVVHFAFVLFAVFGGLLVRRRPRLAWLHIPAVLWAAGINFMGWICPLTPLEKSLRLAAGEAGYEGGFIRHYLLPIIYPEGATPALGVQLGMAFVLWNLAVYGWVIYQRRRHDGH
jgi:hypothetical protein